MTLRHLAVQISFAACALVAMNLGVARLARNAVPRQLLLRAERAEPATHVFLGNSTMAAGLDEGAFAAVRPGDRPLNLGLGATNPVEHYLIYRQQERHRSAMVYYGFLDTQLTDAPHESWASLFGNRAMGYYIEPEIAASCYFPNDPVRRAVFLTVARVPVFVERAAIWAKVERVRRSLEEIGLPKRGTNRFGRVNDFALLEAEPEEFSRRCAELAEQKVPLSTAVMALFGHAKERGAAICVVEMPVTEQHRRRFYETPEWAAYRAHVGNLVRGAGGRFVPAADWIEDDGYADHLHLNEAGARAFSERLARVAGERK